MKFIDGIVMGLISLAVASVGFCVALGMILNFIEDHKFKHVHDWEYGPKTIAGWGVVTCRTCGKTDIY